MNEEHGEGTADYRGSSEGAPSCCGPSTAASECEMPSDARADCCAPAVGSTSRGKLLVFILVVGAALAVLAHGLVNSANNGSEQPTMTPAQGADAGGAAPGDAPPDERDQKEARSAGGGPAPASCGRLLESIPTLKKLAAESEVVFVLLPGEDQERTQAAASQIRLAEMTILRQKRKVDSITLPKDADGHAQLLRQFSVTSFPCVIALGKGCGAKAVSGEITEKKLLKAFVIASAPPSSCSGASDCCPSGGE